MSQRFSQGNSFSRRNTVVKNEYIWMLKLAGMGLVWGARVLMWVHHKCIILDFEPGNFERF